MKGTWKRQVEPFITPCLVLFDFNQVFVKVWKLLHKVCKYTKKVTHKNHVLAPIVGKHLEQKFFLEVVWRVLEGLINRGFFLFSIFTPSLVQCNVQSRVSWIGLEKYSILSFLSFKVCLDKSSHTLPMELSFKTNFFKKRLHLYRKKSQLTSVLNSLWNHTFVMIAMHSLRTAQSCPYFQEGWRSLISKVSI